MIIGTLFALALFIFLSLRGLNIFLTAIICSLIVAVTGGIRIDTALTDYMPFGKLGAFTFAGKFFLLFAAGSIFGQVMGATGAASAIAVKLCDSLGAHRTLWISVICTSLLTYSGVVVFIIIFAMYPLGLRLMQESGIPKRLFAAALALGAGTYTLTAMPGTPSVQNIISAERLGTGLFAAPVMGLIASIMMFSLGLWYLEWQRKKAAADSDHFQPNGSDQKILAGPEGEVQTNWKLSLVPPFTVLFVILAPKLLGALAGDGGTGAMADMMAYSSANPLLWATLALTVGSVICLLIFRVSLGRSSDMVGAGFNNSLLPLLATSIVIGFGGIVTRTEGFADFVTLLTSSNLEPHISAVLSVSGLSALVGSASGGLQIFMATMAEHYLALGVDPAILHRIVTIASGGLDSLPHSGAIVAMLAVTGLTHKEGYRDLFVITVIIPVFVIAVCLSGYLLGAGG